MLNSGTRKSMGLFILHTLLSKTFKCTHSYKLCLWIHEEPGCSTELSTMLIRRDRNSHFKS